MNGILKSVLKVKSYELDSFGHVNNAVYLQYLEAARCDYMQQVGIQFSDFHTHKAYSIVAEAQIKYIKPLFCDDDITILGWFSNWGRVSFVLNYEIYREETLVSTAQLKFAFINDNGRIIPIPDFFKIPFSE